MRFGEFAIAEAEGTMLAHTVRLADGSLSKGRLLDETDIRRLRQAGVATVVAARLEDGDLREDDAAARLARTIAPGHLRFSEATTGRVNIYATVNGLFVADRMLVDNLNRVDPAITLACLPDHVAVREGEMVATFKIIPLAVAIDRVEEACGVLKRGKAFEVKPFAPHAISLIATELPSLKPTVMDKTAGTLARRLVSSRSRLVRERRVAHRAEAVAAAMRECLALPDRERKLLIVFGASAVVDEADVIPEAIRQAGGEVIRVGMPVDPGNLLVLGRVGDVMVVGAPGCARSPKENGFDWVLDRVLSGEIPTASDIGGMGVGGLLMEIQSRPLPRNGPPRTQAAASVAIVLLAAGKADRMGEGGPNKLLAECDGIPLVRRSAGAARESAAASVVVVTGDRHVEIEAALAGLNVATAHNPDYASGMASSLVCGFSAPGVVEADGVMVMLADMPAVTAGDLDALIAAFRATGGQSIVRAVSRGKRANPVILPRSLQDAVLRLEGDVGARHLVETSGIAIIDVDTTEGASAADGVSQDGDAGKA